MLRGKISNENGLGDKKNFQEEQQIVLFRFHSKWIKLHLLCFRLVSFVEFQAFEALLCSPDAMYNLAFQVFDTNGSGFVTYGRL